MAEALSWEEIRERGERREGEVKNATRQVGRFHWGAYGRLCAFARVGAREMEEGYGLYAERRGRMSEERQGWTRWPDGTYVRHRECGYEGVIEGCVEEEHLTEEDKRNPDGRQYRVRCAVDDVQTACWEDLEIVEGAAGRQRPLKKGSSCYACKGPIEYQHGERHTGETGCGWAICRACGACGCGYHGSEPSAYGQAVTRDELERRRLARESRSERERP